MFIGSDIPLAGLLAPWMRAHLAAPLDVTSVATVPDALAHLRSHQADLIFIDEATAQTGLRAIHAVSPTTAIIALVMKMDDSARLLMLRQGVHEVLRLFPSTDTDHARIIEQALARVNGRADILIETTPRSSPAATPPRLIHDLNNLLTSINGFSDLLLTQLPTDNPARISAEQIRLAGKRAVTLLKAQASGHPSPSPLSSPAAPSIATKAA